MVVDKEKNETVLDAYKTTCDGKFINETYVEKNGTFVAALTCTGMALMTMESKMQKEKTGHWETLYSYEKRCISNFKIVYYTTKILEQSIQNIQVITECDGSDTSFTYNWQTKIPTSEFLEISILGRTLSFRCRSVSQMQ